MFPARAQRRRGDEIGVAFTGAGHGQSGWYRAGNVEGFGVTGSKSIQAIRPKTIQAKVLDHQAE
jgi:hypothetical protein